MEGSAAGLQYVHTWLNWVAANGFVLLLLIYFATSASLIVLALYVVNLGRRLARLGRECERQHRLLEKTMKSVDEALAAIEAQNGRIQRMTEATKPGSAVSPVEFPVGKVRDEIGMLLSEMVSQTLEDSSGTELSNE